MNQTILMLQQNDKDEFVTKILTLVGPLTAADGDPDVAADGEEVITENGGFTTKRKENNVAKLAKSNAASAKNSQKKKGIAAYNKAAKKIMEKYPNQPKKWAAMGYPVSKISTKKKKCKKITGGKVKQWIHDGFVEFSWKSLGVEADYYTPEECQGNPAVEENWYPVKPAHCKEASVVIKPKKLGVPTWYRVTGHNSAGEGIAPSNPCGGKPVY